MSVFLSSHMDLYKRAHWAHPMYRELLFWIKFCASSLSLSLSLSPAYCVSKLSIKPVFPTFGFLLLPHVVLFTIAMEKKSRPRRSKSAGLDGSRCACQETSWQEEPSRGTSRAEKTSSWAGGGVLRSKLNMGRIDWTRRELDRVKTDRLGLDWRVGSAWSQNGITGLRS